MELAGWPAGRPGTGELVRIWFSVGFGCSERLKGLVGDGVLRPGKEKVGHVRIARPPPAPLLFLLLPCPTLAQAREAPRQQPWKYLPERKGLRVLEAGVGVTRESRLTREEAAGPRKASGVLQSFRSLPDSGRESARLARSKLFAPSCLVLGNRSPKGSGSGMEGGEMRHEPAGRHQVTAPSLVTAQGGQQHISPEVTA